MASTPRRLEYLVSVKTAMLSDFALPGIRSGPELARRNREKPCERWCTRTDQPGDIRCCDVFSAAVAQMRHPGIPSQRRDWWYTSRQRKARDGRG